MLVTLLITSPKSLMEKPSFWSAFSAISFKRCSWPDRISAARSITRMNSSTWSALSLPSRGGA